MIGFREEGMSAFEDRFSAYHTPLYTNQVATEHIFMYKLFWFHRKILKTLVMLHSLLTVIVKYTAAKL